MKKITYFFFLFSLIFYFPLIKAFSVEETTPTISATTVESTISPSTSTIYQTFKEKLENLKKLKLQEKENIKKYLDELKNEQDMARQQFFQKIQELNEKRRQFLEEKKTELQNKINEAKQLFNEKRKAAIANLYNKINDVNKIQTDNLLKYITQLEEKLIKLEARTKEIEARGFNVESIKIKILEGQNKINELKDKVIAQQNKIIDLSDVPTSTVNMAKDYLAKKIKELREEHQALRQEVVKEGRQALKDVLDEIKKVIYSTSTQLTPSNQ